jgi:hypothetical protein
MKRALNKNTGYQQDKKALPKKRLRRVCDDSDEEPEE